MGEIYRVAASALVLRPVSVCAPEGCGEVHQVLLLHKPRKNDAWQLPQGGVETGETILQAALRELQEEAGITQAEVLGESSRRYQYDFPPTFRRFRPDNVRGQEIHFIIARVAADTTVNVDQREIDSFAWVDPEQLHLYIRREEYLELVRRVIQEAFVLVENTKSQ